MTEGVFIVNLPIVSHTLLTLHTCNTYNLHDHLHKNRNGEQTATKQNKTKNKKKKKKKKKQ